MKVHRTGIAIHGIDEAVKIPEGLGVYRGGVQGLEDAFIKPRIWNHAWSSLSKKTGED